MRANFLGIGDVKDIFGYELSRKELIFFRDIPFSEAVLRECRETHVLAAVPPLSILQMKERLGAALFYNAFGLTQEDWYASEPYASNKGEAGWHLIRTTPVPNSGLKTWDEQVALLSDAEDVPSVRVMAYTIFGHAQKVNAYIRIGYSRCRDLDSTGNIRIIIGVDFSGDHFEGLQFGRYRATHRGKVLTLVSERKPNTGVVYT